MNFSPYALRANVLIHILQHRGVWVPLTDLVERTAVPPDRVVNVCQQLVDENQVLHARIAGIDQYGVGVQGVAPH